MKYTSGFKINYIVNGDKLLIDGSGRELLLTHDQTKVNGEKYFPIPSKKVVAGSTPAASLINTLGQTHCIIGVTVEKEYWYIDSIVKKLEKGEIKNIGTSGMSLNPELLYSLQPDLVLINDDNYSGFEKIKKLGLPVAVFSDYLETTPLGQAEWIKFVAAFFDKDEEAQRHFSKMEKAINKITKDMSGTGKKPKVIWGTIFDGKPYVAGGDSYVGNLISITGGDYVFRDFRSAGDYNVTLEEFYLKGRDSDVFISSTTKQYGTGSIDKLVENSAHTGEFRSVKNGNVWCFLPWYWQSLDKVDEIVEDLAAIFHPERYPGHKIRHFEKLEWEKKNQ